MQDHARVVVIGAGIAGASVAYHLAKLGWSDIVVVDKGPMFETGGSTSHAPGLVFQVNFSKMMSVFARETVELFESLNPTGRRASVVSESAALRSRGRRNASRT